MGFVIIFDLIDPSGTLGDLSSFISAAVFLIPSLSVGARRLHDIGRNGWWLLISLTIVGYFVLIVMWAWPGKPEDAQMAGKQTHEEENNNLESLVEEIAEETVGKEEEEEEEEEEKE